MKKHPSKSLARKLISLGTAALALVAWMASPAARTANAEETVGEKIEAQARETKTGTKKLIRKGKKKVRKATGNDSLKEDAKDAARNASDEIDDATNKLKNKVD